MEAAPFASMSSSRRGVRSMVRSELRCSSRGRRLGCVRCCFLEECLLAGVVLLGHLGDSTQDSYTGHDYFARSEPQGSAWVAAPRIWHFEYKKVFKV